MSNTPPPRGTKPDAGDAPAPLSSWITSHETAIGATRTSPGELRLTPGTMLAGRYRVVALLGRGGMGEIYRAEDTKLGQAVALKFLRGDVAQDPAWLERLLAEVRIGREVSHPNVCRLYDVVEFEGHHFIAMEYVDGEDLATLLRRIGRLPPDKAQELGRELCAGLAAGDDKGAGPRDLKPANVMIDGRGRARITDFGLAVAAQAAQHEAFAGTPAYMAPEQLAGGEATAKSDIYALGLVLFEMFTGRAFYQAKTLDELRSQHKEPKASRLSTSVRFEPTVERVVLQCLDEDPAARPASVRALAVSLPGGDPLDAALLAGETPSPEMVAAAGRAGDLSVAAAWLCLLATVAGLPITAYLADRTTLVGLAPPPKPPAVLAERSQQVLERLGYTGEPADTAFSFDWDQSFLVDRGRREPASERWQGLQAARPGPWRFFYRTSPRKLVAANRDAAVQMDDPPLDVSGMTRLVLDADGRLLSFVAVPPQVDESEGPWPDPDWQPLIQEAGLDAADLTPTPPRWAAPVDSDHKAAWHASSPGASPLRIEAATYHGRPVWFDVQPPWRKPERMGAPAAGRSRVPVGDASLVVLAIAMPLGGLLLARRNMRLGRGDRAGASLVAQLVFVAYSLARLVQADHVTSFGQELWVLVKVFAYPAFWALQVWLLYMALEPYARRRWPHVLISWKRLWAGNGRDPLVGREVLAGCVTGVGVCALYHLLHWVPAQFGIMPAALHTNVAGPTISELRHVVFRLLVNGYGAVLYGLAFLFVLVLLRMLLRSNVLAALVWCLVVAGPMGDEAAPLGWLSGALRALALLLTIAHGGLLRLVVTLFCLFCLVEAPLTVRWSAWYFAHALPVVVVIVALAVYGFRVALAGKSAFGRLLED